LHADAARVSPSAETPYVGLGDPGTTADRTSVEKTPSAQTYPTYSGGAVWAARPSINQATQRGKGANETA